MANLMGGQLVKYFDVNKGFKILRPKDWNEFLNVPGEYDAKWQDVIQGAEQITVTSQPVATATSIDALGEVDTVAEKLAQGRKILSAQAKKVDGLLYYDFEFEGQLGQYNLRELKTLTINKGRLYKVEGTCPVGKRWSKKEEMFRNVFASFVPRL